MGSATSPTINTLIGTSECEFTPPHRVTPAAKTERSIGILAGWHKRAAEAYIRSTGRLFMPTSGKEAARLS